MTADIRRGTVLSFNGANWTALVQLEGSDVESQIPVGQWVPSAMMLAAAEVAVLVFGDTNTDDAVVLGPYGAVSLWNFPAIAGAANGQLLVGSAGSGLVLALITGTANRVTVTNGPGTITLSGPQDLAAASSPTFAGATLTAALKPPYSAGSAVFALDTAGGSLLTVANGATGTPSGNLNNFSGLIMLQDLSVSGDASLWFTANGVMVLVAQSGTLFVQSAAPAAGKVGVFVAASVVSIKNAQGASINFSVTMLRIRASQ